MKYPFYTIGHSTRSIDEFAGMLRGVGVTMVADVRKMPRSRTNPQYNNDALAHSLAPFQIEYEHIAALGGLRGRERNVPLGVNAYWRIKSFHNYADYAMGNDFRTGFARLRELGRNRCCAIMCAEALWWRCHRRIITDYLLMAGEEVVHLIGPKKAEPARLTSAACPGAGVITYPAAS